jgi:hypothetical protein
MDTKNLSTVFGLMSSIFADNSPDLVGWLIDNFEKVFEVKKKIKNKNLSEKKKAR